jgi:GNAT superfamily N-acetyltransferase
VTVIPRILSPDVLLLGLHMYSLKILSEEEVAGFSQFTFPHYRHVLSEMSLGSRMVAVGAVLVRESVGLVFAELQEGRQSAVIRSIAVAPQQRRIGIGTALLRLVERELNKRGCRAAEVIYMAEQPSTLAVEGLLRRNGWPAATPRLMICTSDFDLLSRAPWMKLTDFPPEFEVFCWNRLTACERADILEGQEREQFFPEALSPFAHEDLTDPSCSFGLRYKGRVVGWCVVQQFGANTLRCSSLFVRKEFEDRGRAIALLARSVHATPRTGRPNFIFDVSFERPRMIQFVRRRMAPYLKSIRTTNESRKQLTAESLAA